MRTHVLIADQDAALLEVCRLYLVHFQYLILGCHWLCQCT